MPQTTPTYNEVATVEIGHIYSSPAKGNNLICPIKAYSYNLAINIDKMWRFVCMILCMYIIMYMLFSGTKNGKQTNLF